MIATVGIVRDARLAALPLYALAACEFGALGQAGTAALGSSTGGGGTVVTSESSAPGESGTITAASSDAAGSSDSTAAGTTQGDPDTTGTTGGPRVLPNGPFGDPMPVDVLNSAFDDDDCTLSPDGLELYFESTRDSGTGDLFVSHRETLQSDWSKPVRVPGINVPGYDDGTPALTPDGLALFFSSNRPGGTNGTDDVYLSLRIDLLSAWGAPARIEALSTASADLGPHPAPGGGLHLCSDRPDAAAQGGFDVFFAEDADPTTGAYSLPLPVATMSSPSNDCMFMVRSDGLEAVFNSDRQPSEGNYDLWSATREDPAGRFGAPFPMENVNSPANDGDGWISPDGHELYFATDRGGGGEDIWVAIR